MLTTEITHKQRRFAEEFVIDGNGTRAAVAAGYAVDSANVAACRLKNDPNVIEYIRYLQANQTIESRVTKEYVLNAITEVLERARGKIEVEEIEKENGEIALSMREFKPDPKSALKAAELLGKSLAMFTDVSEQKLTFTQMPDVKLGVGGNGSDMKALEFDVGGEPNAPVNK